MNSIEDNPFRILGVFANDPLKVITANIGKIRAYSKISKEISFDCDLTSLLDDVDRSLPSVDDSISQLSDDVLKSVYGMLWFHRSESFNESILSKLKINANSALQIELTDDYADYINMAVLSLIDEDFDSATKYYSYVISSGRCLKEFKEQIDIRESNRLTNKTLIKHFLESLTDLYPHAQWWPLFNKFIVRPSVLSYVKTVFEAIAISNIKKAISSQTESIMESTSLISRAQQLRKTTFQWVNILKPSDKEEIPSPEAQLVLDKLAEKLYKECLRYYNSEKIGNEFSVKPTIQIVSYALSISYSSELHDEISTFENQLHSDAELLAPSPVSKEDAAIRRLIGNYCKQPDEVCWSIQLIKDCVPHLLSIRRTLGRDNKYYVSISTKVADNALYNCNAVISNLSKMLSLFVDDKAKADIRSACLLIANLRKLDLDEKFVTSKLLSCEKRLQKVRDNCGVNCSDITADITMTDDSELFNKCHGYNDFVKFIAQNPNSKFVPKAKQMINEIEDKDYPVTPTTVLLFAYKKKYPRSHNDARLLSDLDKCLLAVHYGTIDEYKTLLSLYPNHSRKDEIEERINYNLFLGCKSYKDLNHFVLLHPQSRYCKNAISKMDDMFYEESRKNSNYSEYLNRFPKGKHAAEIRPMVELQEYKACKTTADFINYINKYPNSQYSDLAKRNINKKKKPSSATKIFVGILIVMFCVAPFLIYINRDNKTSRKSEQTSVQNNSQYQEPVDDSDYEEEYESTSSNSDYNNENALENVKQMNLGDYFPEEQNNIESDRKKKSKERNSSAGYSDQQTTRTTSSEYNIYKNNRLNTGDKPYASQFGRAKTGSNYLTFKTSGRCDYIVIIKTTSLRYVNHVYINGGDKTTIYLPDGKFYVFFYSGTGWNPNKKVGSVIGGFVSGDSFQKDGPIDLYSAYGEYTLFPVQNGNLQLQSSNASDAL